jgi:hypothetical protein
MEPISLKLAATKPAPIAAAIYPYRIATDPPLVKPGTITEETASHLILVDSDEGEEYRCNDTETHSQHGEDVEVTDHLLYNEPQYQI